MRDRNDTQLTGEEAGEQGSVHGGDARSMTKAEHPRLQKKKPKRQRCRLSLAAARFLLLTPPALFSIFSLHRNATMMSLETTSMSLQASLPALFNFPKNRGGVGSFEDEGNVRLQLSTEDHSTILSRTDVAASPHPTPTTSASLAKAGLHQLGNATAKTSSVIPGASGTSSVASTPANEKKKNPATAAATSGGKPVAKPTLRRGTYAELIYRYNLTYPLGWKPKEPSEHPDPNKFKYKPGRLEFVHIPKTGGTMIESAAARHGVSWTICHFVSPYAAFAMSMGEILCPGNVPSRRWNRPFEYLPPLWHLPSYYFSDIPNHVWIANPYANAELFCVVRNVYDRVISEYHYAAKYIREWDDKKRNSVKVMNRWFKQRLAELKNRDPGNFTEGRVGNSAYFTAFGHWMPQRDYVYDHTGRQVVHHILKYETLHEDFAELMDMYGLNISLSAKDLRAGRSYTKDIGVANLSSKVLSTINDLFADDFKEFGYDMIIPAEPKPSPAKILDGPVPVVTAPAKKGSLEEMAERYNLTYPPGWRPTEISELPAAKDFSYKPGRLEFVHIPKTGGTMIESAAARQGISWALCHFSPPYGAYIMSMTEIMCPGNVPYRIFPRRFEGMPVAWHLPSYYFSDLRNHTWPANPYANATLFSIVRNVYDRLVSEYHYAAKYVRRWDDDMRNSVDVMNRWFKGRLANLSDRDRGNLTEGRVGNPSYFISLGHWIPQRDFVYDHTGRKVVDHVLKYETLHEDFAKLMDIYGMNISLHSRDVRTGRSYEKKIGVAELQPDVLKLINEIYADDFEEFGYDMILPEDNANASNTKIASVRAL